MMKDKTYLLNNVGGSFCRGIEVYYSNTTIFFYNKNRVSMTTLPSCVMNEYLKNSLLKPLASCKV